jgi:hypothetical protein
MMRVLHLVPYSVEDKCMLMSLKNDQQRLYGEKRISTNKDYNSS